MGGAGRCPNGRPLPPAWRVGKPPPQPADAADRSSARLRSASMPLPIFGRADVVSSWPEVAASRIRCRAAWLQTLVGLENFSELKVRFRASNKAEIDPLPFQRDDKNFQPLTSFPPNAPYDTCHTCQGADRFVDKSTSRSAACTTISIDSGMW